MKKVPSSIHFEEQNTLKINITWDWCVRLYMVHDHDTETPSENTKADK